MRFPITLLVLLSVSTMGCNLFGKLDVPGELPDKLAAGIAAANDGRCEEARDILSSIRLPNDDVTIALGWAHLCIGGATASNIASSIYKFSEGSTDLTVVGTLARAMLPYTDVKRDAINKALESFNSITDRGRRPLQVAIAELSLAASILTGQVNRAGSLGLEREDIADASCAQQASDCTVGCGAGMPDSDVNNFASAISSAMRNFSDAGAGSLTSLARELSQGLSLAGADAKRCFIFNRTIPSP